MTVFLGSVERCFSVPADFLATVARSLGQDWPQATGEAGADGAHRALAMVPGRGLDAGEHDGSLIEAGTWPPCAECGLTSRACRNEVNSVSFRHSSRSRPIKLSANAFCCGLPGAI